jgi:hypothetical protein
VLAPSFFKNEFIKFVILYFIASINIMLILNNKYNTLFANSFWWFAINTIVFKHFIRLCLLLNEDVHISFLNFLSDLSYSPLSFILVRVPSSYLVKLICIISHTAYERRLLIGDTRYLHSLIISSLQHAYIDLRF